MPVLYVTIPGATVRQSGESLLVTAEESPSDSGGTGRRKILMEVESHRLELVCIVGRAHITSAAMRHCLERGIAVAWLKRNGEFLGRTTGPMPRSADLRLRQYTAAADTALRLERAQAVVQAKLRNAQAVLRDIQSNSPANQVLSQALAELKRTLEQVAPCREAASLLGIEGRAARSYFEALGASFRADISFPGRRHRPAPDPANALLSFGYVILAAKLAGLLEARGLDPAIGFFHDLRSGRPSLALDLLEELRHPVVDRFVLRSCNLRILRPGHFDPPGSDGGVRLNREGARVFFAQWEEHLRKPMREQGTTERSTPQDLLGRQVERFVSSLRTGATYRPFLYGG